MRLPKLLDIVYPLNRFEEYPQYRKAWIDFSNEEYVKAARILFLVIAIVYLLHYFFIDPVFGDEPYWFLHRMSFGTFYVGLFLISFWKGFRPLLVYRIVPLLVGALSIYDRAFHMQHFQELSAHFCFIMMGIFAFFLNLSLIPSAIAFIFFYSVTYTLMKSAMIKNGTYIDNLLESNFIVFFGTLVVSKWNFVSRINRFIDTEKEKDRHKKEAETQKNIAVVINDDLKKQANLVALAGTTQMLVHDIKRPFNAISMLMNLIEIEDDPKQIKGLVGKYKSRIESSVKKADVLLQEILAVGQNTKIVGKEFDLAAVMERTLNSAFDFGENSNIVVTRDFKHTSLVVGEEDKFERIFDNVINNAIEAMSGSGRLWVATKDITDRGRFCVQIVVGNSGSYIPAEDLPLIFEPFYTKGKKEGVGLGLAICKKIVEAHGGKIWCSSAKETGTEFFILVPGVVSNASPSLSAKKVEMDRSAYGGAASEEQLDDLARLFQKKNGRNVAIAIVDDEPMYSEFIVSLISKSPILNSLVDVAQIVSFDEAYRTLGPEHDLIVVDVDLVGSERNGFDLVRALRQEKGLQSKICIHSSGPMIEYRGEGAAAGADLFLPKPLSWEHLIRLMELVLNSFER